MNDKYLLALWSKAVRAQKGTGCYNPECSNQAHSVHHIIRVGHKLTRYDVRNGIPLCAECHRRAQRAIGWDMDMIPADEKTYLQWAANINIKDWYLDVGLTRAEFEKGEAARLKEIARDI